MSIEDPIDPDRFVECTFCGKFRAAVQKLISGPGVWICNECVDLCNEILEGDVPSWPWHRATVG